MKSTKMEFVVFCIENVAEKLNKSGDEIYMILKKSNLIENYIFPSFEALHTQSKQYIVNDIISIMNEKGLVAWSFFTNQEILQKSLKFDSFYEVQDGK